MNLVIRPKQAGLLWSDFVKATFQVVVTYELVAKLPGIAATLAALRAGDSRALP